MLDATVVNSQLVELEDLASLFIDCVYDDARGV